MSAMRRSNLGLRPGDIAADLPEEIWVTRNEHKRICNQGSLSPSSGKAACPLDSSVREWHGRHMSSGSRRLEQRPSTVSRTLKLDLDSWAVLRHHTNFLAVLQEVHALQFRGIQENPGLKRWT